MLINSILCTPDEVNSTASDPLQKGFGVVSTHLATMLCRVLCFFDKYLRSIGASGKVHRR
ncbi:hypothetical protein [Arcticibacter tournemirensis]|uniref:hypothetical protein n=1 Tax=Arcticibacter tournemirensis TaxID=699437 RepID=UPI0012396F7B|nr:hypothetical protein [Arcticibacter tournemirensis]